jgi:putative tryptophan/tyrosine transport system substrate-binding protein
MARPESHLTRRQFLLGAGVTGGVMLTACGPLPCQQPPPTAVRVYRLGYLSQANPTTGARALDLFRPALAELGYVEGQNLIIEYRWGDGRDAPLFEAVEELTRLPVDVLVMVGGLVARIARATALTVPIVMAGGGDPVAAGLAASYARPGGTVTGVTDFAGPLFGKRLQLLKEAVPSIARVAIFWDAVVLGPFPADVRSREAQLVGVQLHPLEPGGPAELDAAFDAAAREGADALFVPAGPLATVHRERIVQLAARHGWPAMYFERQFVDDGGLMFYSASQADTWRRVAAYVDKILRGPNPADLPIEQAMTFDFVVNMKTAQALGLTFPNETMLQVTEVVQ